MKTIGQKTVRLDGPALVTGQPVFADDMPHPAKLLYLKVLRSEHAHARILKIDATEAMAMPGVVLVLTHKDFPIHYYTTAGQGSPEPSPRDTRILDDKVRFVGDRVALIAAESLEIAEAAAAKIKIDYEILPAILDMRQALDNPTVIHPEPGKTTFGDNKRNMPAHLEAKIGDVGKALSTAAYVFEHEYSTPYVQQSHIEPHITLSWMDENGRLVIRTATQVPFHVRRIVSEVTNFPISKIRVIKPRIGGGFGNKQEILNEELCAAVTLKTGRPARLEYTRAEELYCSRSRHPQIIHLKVGLNKDYTLAAIDVKILENAGAYGPHSLTVMSVTANKLLSLYRCPNIALLGQAVYTNLPPAGAYRGYGAPQGIFAIESMMDEIAHELKIDPIELRHKNYLKVGEEIPIAKILGEGREGFPAMLHSTGLKECLEQGKQLAGWNELRQRVQSGNLRRGIGVAVCGQGSGIPGIDMASAFIKMNEDASFNLLVGATDLGTGSDTALAQIAAEILEVPVTKIIVYSSDTDLTPFDKGAYASSTTYISGGAVKKAALQVKEQIFKIGCAMLNVPQEQANIADTKVTAKDGRSISYEEICTKAMYTEHQQQIMATASHLSYDSPPPFNATFAEVEVNTDTGIVVVKKIVSATDIGQVINPQLAAGQIEGGIPQSLGMALTEYMIFDQQGRPLNTNFYNYHIYTAKDMPEIIAHFVPTHEPTGPFGAKAVAEIPINGPAVAVANAVFHACGVRIRELPIIPEKILRGLGKLA